MNRAPLGSFTPRFDVRRHHRLVAAWNPDQHPSVDVFLPTCGEDVDILRNAAIGVASLRYAGTVTV